VTGGNGGIGLGMARACRCRGLVMVAGRDAKRSACSRKPGAGADAIAVDMAQDGGGLVAARSRNSVAWTLW
jgi:NAD(P)-dependent dehydrogenase (short-subunit alcohol dehydrogenase family)